jgi:hypothetical protein
MDVFSFFRRRKQPPQPAPYTVIKRPPVTFYAMQPEPDDVPETTPDGSMFVTGPFGTAQVVPLSAAPAPLDWTDKWETYKLCGGVVAEAEAVAAARVRTLARLARQDRPATIPLHTIPETVAQVRRTYDASVLLHAARLPLMIAPPVAGCIHFQDVVWQRAAVMAIRHAYSRMRAGDKDRLEALKLLHPERICLSLEVAYGPTWEDDLGRSRAHATTLVTLLANAAVSALGLPATVITDVDLDFTPIHPTHRETPWWSLVIRDDEPRWEDRQVA